MLTIATSVDMRNGIVTIVIHQTTRSSWCWVASLVDRSSGDDRRQGRGSAPVAVSGSRGSAVMRDYASGTRAVSLVAVLTVARVQCRSVRR